jgi:hypothetical protein
MGEKFSDRREAPKGVEVSNSKEAKEDSEGLNAKVVVEMERAGFDGVKVEIRKNEVYKNKSGMSITERHYLPDGHPDKETELVDHTVYTFEHRGIKCEYYPFKEGEVLEGVVNVEGANSSSVVRAANLSSLIMKVKKSVNERDPKYTLELMGKEGFQDAKFDGKDEGGRVTYSFSLKAGVKGDFKVVPGGRGIRMACNIYFGGDGREDFGFLENASTLDEVVSKIKDHIKMTFVEEGIGKAVF